jgi:hypothetical protein
MQKTSVKPYKRGDKFLTVTFNLSVECNRISQLFLGRLEQNLNDPIHESVSAAYEFLLKERVLEACGKAGGIHQNGIQPPMGRSKLTTRLVVPVELKKILNSEIIKGVAESPILSLYAESCLLRPLNEENLVDSISNKPEAKPVVFEAEHLMWIRS